MTNHRIFFLGVLSGVVPALIMAIATASAEPAPPPYPCPSVCDLHARLTAVEVALKPLSERIDVTPEGFILRNGLGDAIFEGSHDMVGTPTLSFWGEAPTIREKMSLSGATTYDLADRLADFGLSEGIP